MNKNEKCQICGEPATEVCLDWTDDGNGIFAYGKLAFSEGEGDVQVVVCDKCLFNGEELEKICTRK